MPIRVRFGEAGCDGLTVLPARCGSSASRPIVTAYSSRRVSGCRSR